MNIFKRAREQRSSIFNQIKYRFFDSKYNKIYSLVDKQKIMDLEDCKGEFLGEVAIMQFVNDTYKELLMEFVIDWGLNISKYAVKELQDDIESNEDTKYKLLKKINFHLNN